MAETTFSRETENLAIVIATMLINSEEREAFDAAASAASFYDEAKTILREILGGRDPHVLWEERRNECGKIRGLRTKTSAEHDPWLEMFTDDRWDGSKTPDALAYLEMCKPDDLTPPNPTR